MPKQSTRLVWAHKGTNITNILQERSISKHGIANDSSNNGKWY